MMDGEFIHLGGLGLVHSRVNVGRVVTQNARMCDGGEVDFAGKVGYN